MLFDSTYCTALLYVAYSGALQIAFELELDNIFATVQEIKY